MLNYTSSGCLHLCLSKFHISSILTLQMAGFLGRLSSPGAITAAVVGGAALTGAYYYRQGTLQAGAAPGQFAV